jgi:dolichol-phosphate mannosyltransferase
MPSSRRNEPEAPLLELSVVLPTYNEAGSIVRFLDELLAVLERCARACEILVLDDASPDGTASLVEHRFAGESRIVVVRRDRRARARIFDS